MRNFSKKAFTLVEVLIVVTVVGFLVGIMLVSLVETKRKAKITKAQIETRSILNAILLLESDTGLWPGGQEAFKVNQTDDNEICPDGCAFGLSDSQAGLTSTNGSYPNWKGPYIKEIPTDPWGNEYFFDTDYDIDPGAGREWVVVIGSYGPDGKEKDGYDSGYADDDIIHTVPAE